MRSSTPSLCTTTIQVVSARTGTTSIIPPPRMFLSRSALNMTSPPPFLLPFSRAMHDLHRLLARGGLRGRRLSVRLRSRLAHLPPQPFESQRAEWLKPCAGRDAAAILAASQSMRRTALVTPTSVLARASASIAPSTRPVRHRLSGCQPTAAHEMVPVRVQMDGAAVADRSCPPPQAPDQADRARTRKQRSNRRPPWSSAHR